MTMSDKLQDNELSFDRVVSNRRAGGIGGQARTPEKLAAVRVNIAKARIAKDWYRRHPELRPERLAAGGRDGEDSL